MTMGEVLKSMKRHRNVFCQHGDFTPAELAKQFGTDAEYMEKVLREAYPKELSDPDEKFEKWAIDYDPFKRLLEACALRDGKVLKRPRIHAKKKLLPFVEYLDKLPDRATTGLAQTALATKLGISARTMRNRAKNHFEGEGEKKEKGEKILFVLKDSNIWGTKEAYKVFFKKKHRGRPPRSPDILSD